MGRTGAVEQVLVVVPARNEDERLPDCLSALSDAATRSRVPVRVVVVLDRCTDGSATVLDAHPHVGWLQLGERGGSRSRGVGAARRAGVRSGLDALRGLPADRVWVASTDADSRVPVQWISNQVQCADDGADLVLGTVALDVQHPVWQRWYDRGIRPDGSHSHVHGANLGVRASSYRRAGGWPPVPAHEDVRLVQSLRRLAGTRVEATSAHAVTTSARLVARAPAGLSADLRQLAAGASTA